MQARFASSLGGSRSRRTSTCCCRCGTTSCSAATRHEPLAPIFSDLTLLGPPTGAALRRALVQPALKCGYRFEDEALVDEMLAEVEGERGALPLARLCRGVAVGAAGPRARAAHPRGVRRRSAGSAGALAQHAEATLERIGQERVPIVRELFRNLVTAQGTRATVDRDELLSVFAGEAQDQRAEAAARSSTPSSTRAS